MAVPISEAHIACFYAFNELIGAVQHPARDFGDQLPLKKIQEEFGKYKIWAGNVGAAHSGEFYEISLDYRLREASFLKRQILTILKTLKEQLENASSLVRGKRPPFEENVEDSEEADSSSSLSELNEEDEDVESLPWDISSSSSGNSLGSHRARQTMSRSDQTLGAIAKLGQTPSQEMPRLIASVTLAISCLYRIPVRRPAPLDRLKDKVLLESSYQHFDVLYVKDKFPLLNSDVANRLGKMVTRRRQLLHYRYTHNQKLRPARVKPVLPLPNALNMGANTIPQRVQSTASSKYTLPSKATTLQPGLLPVPSTEKVIKLKPPSIAESKTSVASSFAGKELRIEIPPRPMGTSGEELKSFECPYCLTIQNIETKRKWK
ncbi:hypothetical protein MMC25_007329 [Agyrium rufum]|nr:hypothetical protein [Agyrium rufum]